MSEKRLPWKSGEGPNLVARALRDHGPMTADEIRQALRAYGQPYIKSSAINKWLCDDLKDSVAFKDGKWMLVGDGRFV